MVPARSRKVSRVLRYSGSCRLSFAFPYKTFTFSGRLSQNLSGSYLSLFAVQTPSGFRPMVWPLSLSLATTQEIDVSFSSSGYLDVSVPRVPLLTLFDLRQHDMSSTCRVSPFGNPWITGYLLLPTAFRSLSRPSSAPSAKAFPLCSYFLELCPFVSLIKQNAVA